ncbi:MAG: YihY family inner membrane protein [Betaproteobacteria bacterium]
MPSTLTAAAQRLLDPAQLRPRLARAREVLRFAARRAREMRLAQVAASLTFTTVLALVPLLAIVAAVFATFPMFAEFRLALEKNLIRDLLPEAYASTLLRNLSGFAAKAGQLTVLGFAFLFVTAMLMIATVDRVLNDLWYVRRQRPLVQRVLVYWALITVGPVLIGASLAASSYLFSGAAGLSRAWPQWLRAVFDTLPVLVNGLAYAALYVLVPNCKVRWQEALIGGFVAAIAGELVKEGFAAYIRAGTVATIYGAFAVAPLFLLWVYLAWFVVLFGAAIAATIPALRATRFADAARAGDEFYTAVALLRALYRPQSETPPEATAAELSVTTRTPGETVGRLLPRLEKLGYLRQLGGDRNGRWRFVADPGRVTLRPLFERLALDPAHSFAAEVDPNGWIGPGELARLDLPLARLAR